MPDYPRLKTIHEVAALCGVGAATVRFYEKEGLLRPQAAGTLQFYSEQDCLRLQLILKGRRLGFSLAEIATLIQGVQTDGPRPKNQQRT